MRRESEITSKGFKLDGTSLCEKCHLFRGMITFMGGVETDMCYCAYDAVGIIPSKHEDCPYFKNKY